MQDHPLVYFDGAPIDGFCGAGFVIKLDDVKVIKGWLKSGRGTNTLRKYLAFEVDYLLQNRGVSKISM